MSSCHQINLCFISSECKAKQNWWQQANSKWCNQYLELTYNRPNPPTFSFSRSFRVIEMPRIISSDGETVEFGLQNQIKVERSWRANLTRWVLSPGATATWSWTWTWMWTWDECTCSPVESAAQLPDYNHEYHSPLIYLIVSASVNFS